jgi:hypothetical protein
MLFAFCQQRARLAIALRYAANSVLVLFLLA